jgi:hypothetical protein
MDQSMTSAQAPMRREHARFVASRPTHTPPLPTVANFPLPSTAPTPQGHEQRPKLLDHVRAAIRTRHYSVRTEKAYVQWIKRFIFFHQKRHPLEMGEAEVGQFLSNLACERQVSASTQNQALNALLFLYREVLEKPLGYSNGVVRAKRPQRLPVVLVKSPNSCKLG